MTDSNPRQWRDEGTFEGGSSMGDGQVSEDITRRWTRQRPDGTWDVYEQTLAVMDNREARNHEDSDSPYVVDERWEYIHCTDPEDPGSTELGTEIEYGEGSYLSYGNEDEALAEARRLATLAQASNFGE